MEAVIFFVHGRNSTKPPGWITLAPYSECPTPRNCDREYADTLAKVDQLEKRLQQQEAGERYADLVHDEKVFGPKRDEIRARLYARMISANCPPAEREFLQHYMSLRIDRRARHHAKFSEYQCYLTARHMDTPKGRRVDKEGVNLDRIG
jgi:hypothetical protein